MIMAKMMTIITDEHDDHANDDDFHDDHRASMIEGNTGLMMMSAEG